jgi:hypothetical protein
MNLQKPTPTSPKKDGGGAANAALYAKMDDDELYKIYASWSGSIHWYLAKIEKHLDIEYVPDTYELKLYEGYAEPGTSSGGVPMMTRPYGELMVTMKLLQPEDNPTVEDLEELLRAICFSAARILNIEIKPRDLERPQPKRELPDAPRPIES